MSTQKTLAKRRTADSVEELARLEKAKSELAEARYKGKLARVRANAIDRLAKSPQFRTPGMASSMAVRASMNLGAYQSGKARTRLSPGKTTPPRASAAATLDWSARDLMVRETQDAERNNSVARTLVQRHIDFVDGDGPIVNPNTLDAKWNDEVRDLYRRFMNGEDHEILGRPNVNGRTTAIMDQREITRAWDVDGDISILKTVDENGLGSFQMVEALRLGSFGGTFGGKVVDGVEMNAQGLPIAFHFSDWEFGGLATSVKTRSIAAEHVIFCPNPKFYRTGQVRGEPRLQSCLQLLELTDGYIKSHAIAAEMGTYFGVIFQDERPHDFAAVLRGAISDQPNRETSDSPYEAEFGPGWSMVTKPGQKPVQMQPEFPTTNFADFVFANIQIMGADFGLPLAIALFASKEMSYSNLRGVLSCAGRGFDFDQAAKARIEKQKYKFKLAEWMNLGLVPFRDDWDKVHIIFPRPPVVDLQMEIDAMAKARDNNFCTGQTATESIGLAESYEEVVKARKKERELEIEAGVVPPDMPGSVRPGQADASSTADTNASKPAA